jgi:hypothetical protein
MYLTPIEIIMQAQLLGDCAERNQLTPFSSERFPELRCVDSGGLTVHRGDGMLVFCPIVVPGEFSDYTVQPLDW